MTIWEKPSFKELAMNAEIGGYQPEHGDDEREESPLLVQNALADACVTPMTAVNAG